MVALGVGRYYKQTRPQSFAKLRQNPRVEHMNQDQQDLVGEGESGGTEEGKGRGKGGGEGDRCEVEEMGGGIGGGVKEKRPWEKIFIIMSW